MNLNLNTVVNVSFILTKFPTCLLALFVWVDLVAMVSVCFCLPAGRPLDKFTPDAHSSCWGGCGSPRKADPGSGRSGRGPESCQGGGDVQHRGREVEEEERSSGGPHGGFHHSQRYKLLLNNR